MKYLIFSVLALGFIVGPVQAANKAKKTSTAHAAESMPSSEDSSHQHKKTHKSGSFSRPYGMAGCGLGSVLIGKRGSQIFAGTTNGTSYNQSFAISTGTLNCVDNPEDEVAQRMDKFLIVNKAALAGDIAKGNGETLLSLSTLMGCGQSSRFGSVLQQNFNSIYPNEKVSPNEVTDSIITVIRSDSALSEQCHQLRTS